MGTFGGYETVGKPYECIRSTAVYRGHSRADPAREVVIKVHDPSALPTGEKSATRSEAFLGPAAVQKKVASQCTRCWAPVYELGVSAEGPFYVTQHYDLSAAKLVEGRAKLNAADVHHVLTSVTEGLLALKRVCGRPHGDLMLSTILIGAGAAVSERDVVLSGPLADAYVDPDTHWRTDLRDVGELLYQLVRHKSTPSVAGWQIPETEEQWKGLGKHGDAWRTLCNQLLAIEVDAQAITLEGLADRLAQITPAPPWPVRKMLVVAGILCAAAVLAIVVPILRPLPWDQDTWQRWRTAAIAWVVELSHMRAERPKGTYAEPNWADVWRQDKYFRVALERIDTFMKPAADNPKIEENYSKDEWEPGEELIAELEALDVPDALAKANKALDYLEAFFFDPNSKTYWPQLGKLSQHRDQLAAAKCTGLSDYLGDILASMARDPDLVGHIKNVFHLQHSILDSVKYESLHRGAIQNDENLKQHIENAGDFVSKLKLLPDHYALDNKEQTALKSRKGQIEKDRANLRRKIELNRSRDGDPNASECARLLEELRTNADPNDIDLEILTVGTKTGIVKACDSCEQAIKVIGKRVPDGGQWWDRTKDNQTIATSEAINTCWRDLRDHWLGGRYQREYISDDRNYAKFLDVRATVKETIANLCELEAALPMALSQGSVTAEWARQLSRHYQEKRREELFDEIIQAMAEEARRDGVFPAPDGYPPECAGTLKWPARANELIANFGAIEARLDACYGRSEGVASRAAGGPDTIAGLYEKWEDTDILAETEVRAALKGLTSRIQTLEAVETQMHRDELVAAASQDPQTEAVYAAWLRLGDDPTWPSDEASWQQEVSIQERLAASLKVRREDGRLSDKRYRALAGQIGDARETREKTFRIASFGGHAGRILSKAAQTSAVGVLAEIQRLTPSHEDDLAVVRSRADLAKQLDEDLTDPNWPRGYDIDELLSGHPEYRSRIDDVEELAALLRGFGDVRRPYEIMTNDPRDPNRRNWDALIEDLGLTDTDFEQYAKDAEGKHFKAALELCKDYRKALEPEFRRMVGRPAIRKYASEIDADWSQLMDANDATAERVLDRIEVSSPADIEALWEREKESISLYGLQIVARGCTIPPYCRRLAIPKTPDQTVMFRPGLGLDPDAFQPVLYQPGATSRPYDTNAFLVLHAPRLNEFRDPESTLLTDYPKLLGDEGFFGITDLEDRENPNLGWPKYVQSVKDPSVILRFVPAESQSGLGPFYMAVREITNAQYVTFLRSERPTDYGTLIKKSNIDDLHPYGSAILSDSGTYVTAADKEEHPVVWVTRRGSDAYAQWLGAQLPMVSWYLRAVEYSKGPLAMDPEYYHVRGRAWRQALEVYLDYRNSENENPLERDPKVVPLGVVREQEVSKLASAFVAPGGVYTPDGVNVSAEWAWPLRSQVVKDLTLSDLVGNVWERCQPEPGDPNVYVFGRSCLSRLHCASADFTKLDPTAQPQAAKSACDLGFRVAVPCP